MRKKPLGDDLGENICMRESKCKAFWSEVSLILEKRKENQCGWYLVSEVIMVPGEGRERLTGAVFTSISQS